MINTFIRLNRKIQEWGWYTNPNTFRLFIHLLIRANYKPKEWEGITIERGQFVTSHDHLASELKLSRQNIRTALKNLIKTKEIEVKSTKQYTLVTIINYDLYQSSDMYTNQQATNIQPTANQQLTTTKESNNIINEKSIVVIERAKDSCLQDNIWVQAIQDHMSITKQQFDGYIEEFTAHATMSGKTTISPEEYKQYFLRWYKKHTGKGFKGRKNFTQPRMTL